MGSSPFSPRWVNVLIHLVPAFALRAYVAGLWSALFAQASMAGVVLRRVRRAGRLFPIQGRPVFVATLALPGPDSGAPGLGKGSGTESACASQSRCQQ